MTPELKQDAMAGLSAKAFSHDRVANGKEEWLTPPEIINALGPFDLDPCAPINRPWPTAANHYTIEDNGLIKPWQGRVWMNPPYGRRIQHWIKKAYEQAQAGATIVCLLPARVDTKWFHEYCVKGDVKLIKGRLFFEVDGKPIVNPKDGKIMPAPFPSMLVIFTPGRKKHTIETLEVKAA